MGHGAAAGLERLGLSASMAKILRYFATHPGERPHLRVLQRSIGLASASAQRDLSLLVQSGLLRRTLEGRSVCYTLAERPGAWAAIRVLVGEMSSAHEIVQDALRGVAGVDVAFIYGSAAPGTVGLESDVDVLVIGDTVDARALRTQLVEAGIVLGRVVNVVRCTRLELAEHLASGTRFVRDVLGGPTLLVAGDPSLIEPIMVSAGATLTVAAENSRPGILDLPGGDLIAEGLDDLARGEESVPALLVSIGAPRLRRLGYVVVRPKADPERRLYDLLARTGSDSAHGRYNALVRRLVSFERAAAVGRSRDRARARAG
jgi:predicted nucleotidyltransferase